MAKCFFYSGGGAEQPQANEDPPAGLDWDMWCGPAPLRPFNRRIHPMGHRQFLDYTNGWIADWGIHWFDQALWIMELEHPKRVFSTGGRSVRGPAVNSPEGQTGDAPDHQVATYDFDDDFTLTWEHRQFGGNRASQHQDVGVHFYGTEGTFYLGWRDGWTFYPNGRKQAPVHEEPQFSGQKDSENIAESWRDFIEAIEQKRRSTSDIETAQRSTNISLLGMLSLKLGRSIRWDGAKQTIPDDPEAAALLQRAYRSPWEYPRVETGA
jgi:predicted dehydrogenase